MATPREKLAAALEELRHLQQDGSRVFKSAQFTRAARERLVKHGFLQDVMKGWLISASPAAKAGDTTPWYAAFWEFCWRYCEDRYSKDWHLSPEQSLLLHAEHTAVPRQVILHSIAASDNRIELPFGMSLFGLKQKAMPPASDLEIVHGLRVFRAEVALTRVPASFFTDHPIEAQVVLGRIREPSQLLSRLLAGGHAVIAGRLAGAMRRLGQTAIADEIAAAMRAADHVIRELDPFDAESVVTPPPRATSPIVARLQTLWTSARQTVLAEIPAAGQRPGRTAYLREVDETYQLDAYHSLSIEGYQVTPELIQRVATGRWDPGRHAADRDAADALAAHGYWLAFQRARDTVGEILASREVTVLRTAHRDWYREMFSPHVAAGLLTAPSLAGYRDHPVYLRGSRHVPPRSDVLHEAMPALFDLIEGEPSPAVRAVLAHWLIGYVHPFPDGNGRIARLVMNALLASGGYPWTVIRVEHRSAYLAALETASVENDLRPLARFIAQQIRATRRSARRNAPRRPRPR